MHVKVFSLVFMFITPTLENNLSNLIRNYQITRSNAADCLVEIIRNINVRKMSIVGAERNSSIVENILKSASVPVQINSLEIPTTGAVETRLWNDLVLTLSENHTISKMLETIIWHTDTRFILIFDNFDGNIFQQFWEEKVINVFALVEDKEDVFVYSFIPYSGNSCNIAHPVIIDKWSKRQFTGNGLLKIRNVSGIRNMNHCPMNVTIVNVKPQVFFHDECSCNGSHHIGGIEGNVMNEISKMFNMEVTYVISLDGIGWGWIKPEPHGVVGEVFSGRSDFGLGLLAPTIERFENLDLSVQYDGDECITYGVPKGAGAKQPSWLIILFFEFPWTVWLLIGFFFIVGLVLFWLVNKSLKFSLFPDKLDMFMYLLASCLGIPINIHISCTLRIAIISWILFTFIITVAYKSSMGSKLTVPTPDPDINTFKELLKSDLKLTGYNNMLRLIEYNDSEADIQLMAHRFVVTNFDIDQAVRMVAKHEKIAHVRHRSTFLYYSLINTDARGHIHLLQDCIYRYYPIFVMKKNSPFRKRANEVIMRLNEGGIVNYWKSWYSYRYPKKPNTFEKLSLSHTYGMFVIIFCGYGIALICFIAEIIFHHFVVSRLKNVNNKNVANVKIYPKDNVKDLKVKFLENQS